MADSTLAAIRTKVRRLTRSPSTLQLTDAALDEYVNTFIQYDFPEHLRLFSLETTLEFFTEPNQDRYTPNVPATNPLFEFDQEYITFEGPVYIAGYEARFSQSRSEFYRLYPLTNSILNSGSTGNGVAVAFAGTLTQIPILPFEVTFSSIDTAGDGLVLYDPAGDGILSSPDGVSVGTINYITGAYTLTWAIAPRANETIFAEVIPYVAARPQMLLYFDNTFFVRPVPDMPYKITINAYIRPAELLAAGTSPQLEQWWQYIAYGAAKKVLEDRMDLETVALIMPEFKKQEALVLRRTLVQQANERVATIYVDQAQPSSGGGFNPFGSPF
jgi:hypothetical protein